MKLLDLYNILQKVDIPVYHYETELQAFPYIIYQELSTSYTWASGKVKDELTPVVAVHFSKTEFDPTVEKLKEVLLEHKIGHTINIDYDPATKVIVNEFMMTIKDEKRLKHEKNY